MRFAGPLALLVTMGALGACDRDVDMYPIGPGGGGPPGGGMTPDAAIVDSVAEGSMISGRVCLIDDARSPTSCATSGAMGLTVTLGSATTTTTADDGSFMIVAESGTNLVWRVTGTGIQAAAMQVSTVATIPAISSTIFEDMVTSNQAISGDGTGSVIARLTIGGAGVSGLVATTSPDPEGAVYYDGTSATTWDATATGTYGVVWVPGLAAGSAELSLTGSHTATISGIPVYGDTVTFVLATVQ